MKKINFNLDEWKGKKVVMHCPEFSQLNLLCDYLKDTQKIGAFDKTGLALSWSITEEETCYDFLKGSFGTVDFYRENGYEILEISDFITEIPNTTPVKIIMDGEEYEYDLPNDIAEEIKKTRQVDDNRADTLLSNLRQFARVCNKEKLDFKNKEQKKWYIGYSYNDECFYTFRRTIYNDLGVTYFDTEETAQKAIETYRDELIWYFTEYLK